MTDEAFTRHLAAIFEASPWVPRAVAAERPFASVAALHAAMTRAVRDAPEARQLELIRAHPDLGSRLRMSRESVSEQAGAGLDRLSPELFERFTRLNAAYRERFGFPFIIAVRGRTTTSILEAFERRVRHDAAAERDAALREIAAIARFRLDDLITEPREARMDVRNRAVYYGKGDTFVYRTHARPLRGVRVVPESAFAGRDNTVFGASVEILVHGAALWPAYTDGDNSPLVATDSMKNFVQREALNFDGATLEAFLDFLAVKFLTRYPHLEGARLSARERPFPAATVPHDAHFVPSDLVFHEGRAEHAHAHVEYERDGDTLNRVDIAGGLRDLRLLKVTGSAFHGFIRDEYTTLPDLHDRALFTFLDVTWRYANDAHATGDDPSRYVPAEQVRDIAAGIFNDEGSESIQQLMYRIGTRLFERYPELQSLHFEGQNRTWEQVAAAADGRARVLTEPRPPYGILGLSMNRGE